MERFSKKSSFAAGLIAAAALILMGAGCTSSSQAAPPAAGLPPTTETTPPFDQPSSEPTPAPIGTPPTTEPPQPVSSGTPSASAYKDGTYTATGNYRTHAGPESVQVTLTLKGGIITDSQFSATPNERMSGFYQQMFADNYKPMVIGMNIDQVNLGKVSGSSLTPMGFNDALASIKAQAKA